MRVHLFTSSLATFFLAACYQPASVLTSEDILTIEVLNAEGTSANGENYLDITIKTDERAESKYPITLTTSSGVLNFNADNSSSVISKQTTVYNDSTGAVTVKMRVGLTPGDVFLTAQATVTGTKGETSNYLAQKTLFLEVSEPDTIEVIPKVFNVPADGTQAVNIDTQVYGPPVGESQLTTQVSYGTNYAVGVCCGTANSLETCSGQPSLRAPRLMVLDDSQKLNFDVLTRQVTVVPYIAPEEEEPGTGTTDDQDGDGFSVEGGDCNDDDPTIHPGATDLCGDNIDQDCDDKIDEGTTEICGDEVDNDCDDAIDEGFPDTDQDGAPDCVDLEIDQFLIVEYVRNPGEEVDCDRLDEAVEYGMAHMVLEAIPIQ